MFDLVVLDIDGTIVDYDNSISPAHAKAIAHVREQGVPIVLATGRGAWGAVDVAQRLGLDDGLGVCSNGAVVFTYDPFEMVHAETFDASDAVRRVLERKPDALVCVEEFGGSSRVNRPFPEGELEGEQVVESLESLLAKPATRVVVRAPGSDRDEFADLIESLGISEHNYFVGYTAWLDLAPVGVSKASAMQIVTERMGIDPAKVLAVGDGYNDVEMLSWAGRGVAMGQAADRLKSVADDVTGSVQEDGLAQELLRWW